MFKLNILWTSTPEIITFNRIFNYETKLPFKSDQQQHNINVNLLKFQKKSIFFRQLNNLELKLFTKNNIPFRYNHRHNNRQRQQFELNVTRLQYSLVSRFNYNDWKFILIDARFTFILAGGSIINSLYQIHSNSRIDIDLFAYNCTHRQFIKQVQQINQILGTRTIVDFGFNEKYSWMHVLEIPWETVTLQFIWFGKIRNIWQILYKFDLDICQIAFDGKNILTTYACIESMKTNTILTTKCNPYSFVWCKRLKKYINRYNMVPILPKNFKNEPKDLDHENISILLKQHFNYLSIDLINEYPINKILAFYSQDIYNIREQFIAYMYEEAHRFKLK